MKRIDTLSMSHGMMSTYWLPPGFRVLSIIPDQYSGISVIIECPDVSEVKLWSFAIKQVGTIFDDDWEFVGSYSFEAYPNVLYPAMLYARKLPE